MLEGCDTLFFTDESKVVCGVSAEVLLDTHAIYSRIRQCIPSVSTGDTGSLSMAGDDPSSKRNTTVLIDSQVAIKALYSAATSSRLGVYGAGMH